MDVDKEGVPTKAKMVFLLIYFSFLLVKIDNLRRQRQRYFGRDRPELK